MPFKNLEYLGNSITMQSQSELTFFGGGVVVVIIEQEHQGPLKLCQTERSFKNLSHFQTEL